MADLRITPFRSADKEGHRPAPQGNLPPWPARVLFTGRSGTGKTSSILNLIRAMMSVDYPPPEDSKQKWTPAMAKLDRKLDRVYVIHLDDKTAEFDALRDVCDRFEIIGVGDVAHDVSVLPRQSDFDGNRRNLIVLEEIDFDALPKQAKSAVETLFRYISSHSNCSVMASYQEFFKVPKPLRENVTGYVLFAPANRSDWDLIARRVALPAEILAELFNDAIFDIHESISIWPDLSVESPFHIRINMFGPCIKRVTG